MDRTSSPSAWANDAFMALSDDYRMSMDFVKELDFSSLASNTVQPSVLATAASTVERYGQVTPPEELSPIDHIQFKKYDVAADDEDDVRWASRALQNGAFDTGAFESLTVDDNVRGVSPSFTNRPFDSLTPVSPIHAPDPSFKRKSVTLETGPTPSTQEATTAGEAPKKRRRSTKTTRAAAPTAEVHTAEQPTPAKRGRGRPKARPQPSEDMMTQEPEDVKKSDPNRLSHLEKNRKAAHKCRQRKKEMISSLEANYKENEARNKALRNDVTRLRQEVMELKNELLNHTGCGCWQIDQYLARSAANLVGGVDNTSGPSQFNQMGSSLASASSRAQAQNQPIYTLAGISDQHPQSGISPTDSEVPFQSPQSPQLELRRCSAPQPTQSPQFSYSRSQSISSGVWDTPLTEPSEHPMDTEPVGFSFDDYLPHMDHNDGSEA